MRRLLGKVGQIFVRVKKNNFLGKLKRFSVRNLKCADFWGSGRESVIKSKMQISRQTRVVFDQEIKCLGFLRKPVRFSVRNLNMQILGQNWGFSCQEWNLDEMFATFARWFFSHGFSHVSRVFARFSHDLFFQRFFSHGFSHVSHGFARFSHDLLFQGFLFARFARARTIFAHRP